MNEWMMHLYSAFCVLLYTQSALQSCGGVSPQPPPVCSIHLDDATAATGQRRQCAHHTPATGGEERESEPIKWMGIIRRPWLTRASGGNLTRTPGLHPTLYEKCHGIFNDHRESGPRFLTSHPKDGACLQYSVPITILGCQDPHRPQGEHPLLASLTPSSMNVVSYAQIAFTKLGFFQARPANANAE